MLQYDRKKVGQHLKSMREKAELTQAAVSSKLGYSSPQFISNIERGISVAPIPLMAKMTRLSKSDPQALAKIILKSQEALLMEKLVIEQKSKSRK
jgi:transcriptional regulator with XRE-family HTH domain